ncbi:hypothetical protein ACFQLX_21375 [Streptomyces polyrhachis]|uniref:Type III polyketide synthase n=1 Tax=Streptomyces polyrhachis TaxID=1282885 RepID=A0ABW2GIS3_9ACTN
MPVVTAPVIALPKYQATTDELLDHLEEKYREHPGLARIRQVIQASTVASRWYTRPLAEQFAEGYSLSQWADGHFQASLDLAESAARGALLGSGLCAGDIDAVVVISATGYTMPGLDVRLVERLGLPCSVRRISGTHLGCVGGVYGLCRAMEVIAARPGSTVLVVCADIYSHYLHSRDDGMDGMIFKGIIGDAAGACVVRAEDGGPRMELGETWEYVQPLGRDIVGYHLGNDGFHVYNSPRLLGEIRDGMPLFVRWLEGATPVDGDAVPSFVVSHTGSPKVIDAVVEGLGCAPRKVALARDSLRELGNIGSVSILDVLERTFAKPPADGADGLMLAVGPGVSMMAVKVTYRSGD